MSESWRIRIKICGMTRLADAVCAVESGVDALGFIFYQRSPRAIKPQAAALITCELAPFVDAVGVFVNEEINQAVRIIRECRLGYAQLHGTESPEYCRELAERATPCRVIKAIRVGEQSRAADAAPYDQVVHGFLLDTYQKNAIGGTGQPFNWDLISHLQLNRPFLLAGGLDPHNIRVALEQVHPYGVDANSGLEDAPGLKNHHLIRQFIAAVRTFEGDYLSRQQ